MREEIVFWSYIDLSRFKVEFISILLGFLSTWLKCILAFSGQTANTKINAYY